MFQKNNGGTKMSDKTIFLRFLEEVNRSTERMIQRLLENPSCIDGLEKKEAYSIALEYFKWKQKKTKTEIDEELANAHAAKFEIMLENYADAPYNLKDEHAKQIALYIVRTGDFWLKIIPQELKDEVFRIIFRYLEQQMNS